MALGVAFAFALAAPATGCKRSPAPDGPAPAASAAPVVLKDDTAGLLLTWIDEKGDFHVEQSAKDIPLVGRDAVRVVDPAREQSDAIDVADLRTARPDGTYAVHTMTRAAFDELAIQRRQKHAPTLAGAAASAPPQTPTPAGTGPLAPPAQAPQDPSAGLGRPLVIVYGASWCGPCHQAADFLKAKNISYVMKDIEEDPGAAAELRDKLRKAGMQGGSIPVLDVRGQLFVGFNPNAVMAAIGQAL